MSSSFGIIASAKFHPQAMDMIGILPIWVQEAFEQAPDGSAKEIAKLVIEQYGFPINPMSGGKVDVYGRYHYTGDPILEPLARTNSLLNTTTVYYYSYAMICFEDASGSVMYRMD